VFDFKKVCKECQNNGIWASACQRCPGANSHRKQNYISNRFVRGATIVEYGPVPAKALLEQIHEGKVLDF
jgi:DnaJ-class molecular chaperone